MGTRSRMYTWGPVVKVLVSKRNGPSSRIVRRRMFNITRDDLNTCVNDGLKDQAEVVSKGKPKPPLEAVYNGGLVPRTEVGRLLADRQKIARKRKLASSARKVQRARGYH